MVSRRARVQLSTLVRDLASYKSGGSTQSDSRQTHAQADDCSFDGPGFRAVPSTATPSAQKWNDVGADMILAQNFKRLVHRRNTLVSEGIDSFLPSHHTVLATLIVLNLMRDVLI
jgi:hypothetical protein